jgi:hypothetical protein
MSTHECSAARAGFGVPDCALQQRATQQPPDDWQFADQLMTRSKGLLANHSQERITDLAVSRPAADSRQTPNR